MESHVHRFRRLSAIALTLGVTPKGHRTVNQVAGIIRLEKTKMRDGIKYQLGIGEGKVDYLFIETKHSAFLPVTKTRSDLAQIF